MANGLLKVILVEDNPADARLLSLALAGESVEGMFQLEWEPRLSQALARLSMESFDAMVLDLGLPDSQGFETFAKVRERAAQLPILLLTGMQDSDLALRAVQEGAQDYLVKGKLDGPTVARAIRFAVERYERSRKEIDRTRESMEGRIVAVAGAKGGVGATTVSLNLATLLAQQKRSVNAIELRGTFGSFSSQLKASASRNLGSMLREDSPRIDDVALETCLTRTRFGFQAIFGPQKRDELTQIHPDAARTLVLKLSRRAQCALVEIPDVVSPPSEAVLRMSHYVILVSENDDSSVAAARVALESIRAAGVGDAKIGMTLVNRATLVEGIPAPDIEAALACEVLGLIPSAPDICLAGQRSGTPLVVLRPHSLPAICLARVLQRVLIRVPIGQAVAGAG